MTYDQLAQALVGPAQVVEDHAGRRAVPVRASGSRQQRFTDVNLAARAPEAPLAATGGGDLV
jgi:hypothetical protein